MATNKDYLDERMKEYLDDEILGELIPNEDTYDSDYGWLDEYEETHQEEEVEEDYDALVPYLNYLYYQL